MAETRLMAETQIVAVRLMEAVLLMAEAQMEAVRLMAEIQTVAARLTAVIQTVAARLMAEIQTVAARLTEEARPMAETEDTTTPALEETHHTAAVHLTADPEAILPMAADRTLVDSEEPAPRALSIPYSTHLTNMPVAEGAQAGKVARAAADCPTSSVMSWEISPRTDSATSSPTRDRYRRTRTIPPTLGALIPKILHQGISRIRRLIRTGIMDRLTLRIIALQRASHTRPMAGTLGNCTYLKL